jgi:hypothetical protein
MSKKSVWFVILPFALTFGAGKAAEEKSKGKAATEYRTPFGVLHSDGKTAEPQAKPLPPERVKNPGDTPGWLRGNNRLEQPTGVSPGSSYTFPVTVKVTEEGDSLRFERPSPFGVRKWTRKKTELTEMEKAAWELAKTGQSPQSGKSKE